ncbi:MAG TPA: aminotransferase class I/II-fold pyridoxal phosphate-dependent enzyme [Rhizomicrobium sp.]|jgi:aspartate/methionine/tyrosine aminotransferase|nr:aminotransferase class I/II-fold pyridoxal phosphate-dependent enzyme [Rhizomicrobium sp.]
MFAQLGDLLEHETPGAPVVNLSVGDPRGVVPAFVTEALVAHAHQFGEYPPINGTADWRAAAAAWIASRFGLPQSVIDPEKNVLPLSGTREGLFLAPFVVTPETKAGARPAILLPNPFYQCYAAAILAAGAEPIFVRTGADFLPDYVSLPKAVLERTVAAYICSPSNPEGAAADADYWRALFGLADAYDFTVFADECYADIYLDKRPTGALTARFAQTGGVSRLLTFHSLSKRSCLPGLRSGIVAGDAKLLATFRQFRNYSAPQVAMPIQAASAAAWRDEAHVAANRATYAARFLAARRLLGNRSNFRLPDGGFFLWLDVGDGVAATRKLWREAGIRVLPGAYMGRETEPGKSQSNPGFSFIRVALVSDLSTIEAALGRMGEILSGQR